MCALTAPSARTPATGPGRLPNALIIGVSKAGTTSLFDYLTQHPEVAGSKPKETLFFSDLVYSDFTLPPIRNYRRFFRHTGAARIVMEASPNYWYGGRRLLSAL